MIPGALGAFTTSQINKGQLAHNDLVFVLEDFLSYWIEGCLHKSDSEHTVAAARLCVQCSVGNFTPLLT